MYSPLKKLLSSTSLLVSISFLGMGECVLASRDMTEELKSLEGQIIITPAIASSSREEVVQAQSSPSLPDILRGLTTPDMDLLTRAKKFNPSGLFTKFHQELRGITLLIPTREQAIYELVVKGMWALYFHHFITGEILADKGKSFLETLREVTKPPVTSSSMSSHSSHKKSKLNKNAKASSSSAVQKPKKLFSQVPKANGDQRDLLERLYLHNFRPNEMSEILGKFFGVSSSVVSKKVIDDTSRAFEEEISKLPDCLTITRPILRQNNSEDVIGPFLHVAIYFKMPWALQTCKELWLDYLDLKNNNEAEKWLNLGVEAEHLESMHMLAVVKKDHGDQDSAKALHMKVVQAVNSTPLRMKAEQVSYHESLFNLALQEHEDGYLDKAREYYNTLVQQNHLNGIYNLAILEYQTGNIDKARELYQLAASRDYVQAIDNLAIMEYYAYLASSNEADRQKYRKSAKEALRKAISLKFHKSNLLMARILCEEENFTEAEKLLRDAISFGVKDADLHYAGFLHERSRFEEGQKIFELYEESLPEADRLNGEEDDSEQVLPEKVLPLLETLPPVVVPDLKTGPSGLAEKNHREKPSMVSEPEAAPSAGWATESVERYVAPGVPKRLQKYLARAEAQEEKERQQRILNRGSKTPQERTYQDVEIKVLPKSTEIFRHHEITIKKFISRLANGEKPNDCEKLEGYDDIYSMRLGRVGRVIFRITGWCEGVVSALTLLSIDDHYETLKSVSKSTTAPVVIKWE